MMTHKGPAVAENGGACGRERSGNYGVSPPMLSLMEPSS